MAWSRGVARPMCCMWGALGPELVTELRGVMLPGAMKGRSMFAAMSHSRRRGFSLVELVVVVVILGIIGAIAIPRMSRGAAGAADSALIADLAVLRSAIELYQTEHGGTFPALATFSDQLTLFSDDAGNTNATKTTVYQYGPYLRKVPALKVGTNKGANTLTGTAGGTEGWLYNATTGEISANLPDAEVDSRGVQYNAY